KLTIPRNAPFSSTAKVTPRPASRRAISCATKASVCGNARCASQAIQRDTSGSDMSGHIAAASPGASGRSRRRGVVSARLLGTSTASSGMGSADIADRELHEQRTAANEGARDIVRPRREELVADAARPIAMQPEIVVEHQPTAGTKMRRPESDILVHRRVVVVSVDVQHGDLTAIARFAEFGRANFPVAQP